MTVTGFEKAKEALAEVLTPEVMAMLLTNQCGCPDKTFPLYEKQDKRCFAPDKGDEFIEDRTYSCNTCWEAWLASEVDTDDVATSIRAQIVSDIVTRITTTA